MSKTQSFTLNLFVMYGTVCLQLAHFYLDLFSQLESRVHLENLEAHGSRS